MSIHKYLLVSISIFGILITSYLLLATTVVHGADGITVPGGNNSDLNNAVRDLTNLGNSSPIQTAPQFLTVLATIVRWLYTIFFIVAIALILFAAFNYLFAQGDATKISTAHKQLIWAAVAIAVALISVGVVQIVNSFIRGSTSNVYQGPNPGTTLPGQEP